MNKISLQKKLVLQIICTCFLFSGVLGYGLYSLKEVSSVYRNVAIEQFPKVESATKMVALFRLIRINVRSLAVTGNDEASQSNYINLTKESIGKFLEEKKKFDSFNFSKNELKMVDGLNSGWKEFFAFGKDLLSKYENPSESSYTEAAHMIRVVCPVKAAGWMNIAEEFVKYQSDITDTSVKSSYAKEKSVTLIVIVVAAFSILLSLVQGILFSKKISHQITNLISKLTNNASNVGKTSQELLKVSSGLSETSKDSANSIQETASAIDEISSMISNNAESAKNSSKVSQESNNVVLKGKGTVEKMIQSIQEIEKSNDEFTTEIQKSNSEFEKIVSVISEIGDKTKVINDIVFQTKLLSFNASVEAARAGDAGKGFAVVAEEVGNLASMSGGAAMEISEMLERSVKQVKEIVEYSKVKVDSAVNTSKQKIEVGTKTAYECGESLDEISKNMSLVDDKVKHIAMASSEQAVGVKEVTGAIQNLDEKTAQNSNIAVESTDMAQKLKAGADELNLVIDELNSVITGKTGKDENNIIKLEATQKDDFKDVA